MFGSLDFPWRHSWLTDQLRSPQSARGKLFCSLSFPSSRCVILAMCNYSFMPINNNMFAHSHPPAALVVVECHAQLSTRMKMTIQETLCCKWVCSTKFLVCCAKKQQQLFRGRNWFYKAVMPQVEWCGIAVIADWFEHCWPIWMLLTLLSFLEVHGVDDLLL